jgi:hypothetical protein
VVSLAFALGNSLAAETVISTQPQRQAPIALRTPMARNA